MGNPWIDLGVLIALLLINGVFAASELALVSAKRSRLEAGARRSRAARLALALHDAPGPFLATVQVGITLISTVSAIFAGETFVRLLGPALRPALGTWSGVVANVVVVVGLTFLSLILGELAPKNLALRDPEGLSRRVDQVLVTPPVQAP